VTLGTAPAGDTGRVARAAGRVAADDEGWRLRDEEQFLRRSLEDAEREHQAGDLSDEDFRLLAERDRTRLAEVHRLLDQRDQPAGDPEPPVLPAEAERASPGVPATARRHRRWWLAALGTTLVLAGMVLLVVDLEAPRLPGQTPTGGVSLDAEQRVQRQLAQAATLVEEHRVSAALGVYDTVLAEDPRQPEALAQWGWLEWGVGARTHDAKLVRAGAAFVAEALRADPQFTAAHLYMGTIDEAGGDDASAVAQYGRFLADHPPAAWVHDSALLIEKAYRAQGLAVPAVVLADAPPAHPAPAPARASAGTSAAG
jgi:cytochrome c-type biogenesis protein CcmH/NrfG